MTLLPPQPATPVVTPWWRKTPVVATAITVAIVVMLGIGTYSESKSKKDDGGSTELCAALRDPSSDNLTTGDWEDLTGWPEWKIARYVNANCPTEADRFGG